MSIKSPPAFAPLTKPSCTSFIASSMLIPKPLDSAFAARSVSLKSVPKCSDTACTLLRSFSISSPVFPVSCVIAMFADCKPFMRSENCDKADETVLTVFVMASIACTPWLQFISDFLRFSAGAIADCRTFLSPAASVVSSLNSLLSPSSLNVILIVLLPAIVSLY